jgi:hypothetical protein
MSTRLPITALDLQLDLLRHCTNSEFGRSYANAVVGAALHQDEDVDTVTGNEEVGFHVHRTILGIGGTYAVTRDIVDVLEQAAPSLPSFILHVEDLPSPHGFVWLERAIVVPDINDKSLVVRGFGWTLSALRLPDGTSEPAVIMLAWTDPRDPRDHAYGEFRDAFGAPLGLLSMLAGIFPINVAWQEAHGRPKATGLGEFWLTLLRFMDEPWINTERYEPDRHLSKRAMRTLNHVPEVHVVHLRRAAARGNTDPGAGNVEWSHRWLVRGHWRNQWYPSLEVHKPRWIAEHVKGPEHAPLVVHDKIFSVER